jgi:hypothetical protein
MDLKELQAKLNKQKNVVIKYDANGNPFVSMPVGSVPLKQFEEFESVCNSEYNGNRWLMIWTMFLRMKHFDLEAEVEFLKREVSRPVGEDDTIEESNPLGLLTEGK